MKQVALYARVSSDRQKEEGTIASQIYELKQQIARDGNVITKEYVDDGWSGARIDRPALEELRADLKRGLFDAVYFHNVDRIARDVTFQHIIIGDILKHEKQIVINGKDYVENPENKFALTVLGAVAELEKAKIIERTRRGKLHKARLGILPEGGGSTPYGYTFVKKSDTAPQHYVINEKQAAVVRFIFETYVNTETSLDQLMRSLEERNFIPQRGSAMWDRSSVHRILSNTGYYGVRHYFTTAVVHTHDLNKGTTRKVIKRDRSEWVAVNMPVIISKDLFDRAQAKLAARRNSLRSPQVKYLLSGLVKCEKCGYSYTGLRRRYRLRNPAMKYRYYQCNHDQKMRIHSAQFANRDRCDNKEVSAARLEVAVWETIISTVLNATALKGHVQVLRTRTRKRDQAYQQELTAIEKELNATEKQKKRVLDLYAEGHASKASYFRKIESVVEKQQKLRGRQAEIIKLVPLISKTALIRKSIEAWCEQMSARLPTITTLEAKHQLLVDMIESISFNDDVVKIRGFVPLLVETTKKNGTFKNENAAYRLGVRLDQWCHLHL